LLRAAGRVVEVLRDLDDRTCDVRVADLVLALVRVDVLLRLLAELHDRLVRVAVAALDRHHEDVDHVRVVPGRAHGAAWARSRPARSSAMKTRLFSGAALLAAAPSVPAEEGVFEKTIPFPRRHEGEVGITYAKCTIRSLEARNYPDEEDVAKAR